MCECMTLHSTCRTHLWRFGGILASGILECQPRAVYNKKYRNYHLLIARSRIRSSENWRAQHSSEKNPGPIQLIHTIHPHSGVVKKFKNRSSFHGRRRYSNNQSYSLNPPPAQISTVNDPPDNLSKHTSEESYGLTNDRSVESSNESPHFNGEVQSFHNRSPKLGPTQLDRKGDVIKNQGFSIRFTNNRFESRASSHSDKLISLFRNISPPSDTSSSSHAPSLELFKHKRIIQCMMIENKPLSETWTYLVDHFGPDVLQIPSSPVIIQPICNALLNAMVESKYANPFDSRLPSLTTITHFLLQINSLSGKEWTKLVVVLLEKVSVIKGIPVDDESLILDIVGAWNIVSNCSENHKLFSVKNLEEVYKEKGLDYVFGMTIASLRHRDMTRLPLVSIALFGVLTKESTTFQSQSTEIKFLIKLLATVISIPNLDIKSLESRNHSKAINKFVLENWTEIREKACQIMDSSMELKHDQSEQKLLHHAEEKKEILSSQPRNLIRGISTVYAQLQSAVRLKNHSLVDSLWSKVTMWQTPDPESAHVFSIRDGTLSEDICNHFISAYMKLHRPADAIAVWEHMKDKGLEPNVKTWNSMMSGCKLINDWRSSEKIWKMMSTTGLLPDAVSWSTRISVLMESGEYEMGIKVLYEMGHKWFETAKKEYPLLDTDNLLLIRDVKHAIKPDITCINIAIAGFLAKGKRSIANQIVLWGRRFGVKPNAMTYNIFLRRLVRIGAKNEAMSLLKRMDKAGIEADAATYTIILDDILRFPEQYSPEELKEKVDCIFADMEKANVQPNIFTYGKVIRQLVRDLNHNNSPTIEVVLQRMSNQGLKPSVQIYTSILEYHLLQTPPNLDMARYLIDKATEIVGLDRVFWDRMIICFAKIGETTSALNIISKLSTRKTRVGWSAMRSVLEALLAQKQWDLAKSLVKDAKMSDSRKDFRGETQGEALFWRLADQLAAIDV